jgi:hypothetical protein
LSVKHTCQEGKRKKRSKKERKEEIDSEENQEWKIAGIKERRRIGRTSLGQEMDL